MAKHRIGVDRALLRRGRHVLLVRDPAAVIQSFAEVLEPTLTVRALGLPLLPLRPRRTCRRCM